MTSPESPLAGGPEATVRLGSITSTEASDSKAPAVRRLVSRSPASTPSRFSTRAVSRMTMASPTSSASRSELSTAPTAQVTTRPFTAGAGRAAMLRAASAWMLEPT